MSSDASIEVHDLRKTYRIGTGGRDTLLAEAVRRRLRHPFRAGGGSSFDALAGVSFGVTRGEVVGVVGRNGAGKSTLLKVLSRITEPTSGRVLLWGEVGSLLEVGTGFHPELTGAENVYLNGAILGMRTAEIADRFDDIVEFAGVERFLDTPVKRYSSGMYVRLAFAVAAHLRADILIVDEVLAVGDAEFQQRCIGKMRDVATDQGRTVLFVSHNVSAVQRLCERVIVLDRGRINFDGGTAEGLAAYHSLSSRTSASPGEFVLLDRENPHGAERPLLLSALEICTDDGPSSVLRTGAPARFVIRTRGDVAPGTYFRIHIRNGIDQIVLGSDSRMCGAVCGSTASLAIRSLPLLPGRYAVDVGVATTHRREVLDFVVDAGTFDVEADDVYGPDYDLIPEDSNIYLAPDWSSPP